MLPTLRWVSAGRQAECRPASGCRPLDDGPFWAGETFTDSAAGVRIEVLRADGNGETVRITKS
ncbi:hypothetical protein [Streptomyces decoyicus]|uniref:hypothetical protein n=1 Tax=Streptomyces decoyicus TaxID=249567 RepID=UPI0033A921D4